MVGTLVLQLLVVGGHTGGVLSVKHAGECLDFDGSPPAVPRRLALTSPPPGLSPPLYATAFFAGCVHKLRPVTAGARLCLLYNLVMPAAAAGGGVSVAPRAPRVCPATSRVRNAIRRWATEMPDAGFRHVVLRLVHKYTAGRLSMKALKPCDATLADFLLSEERPVRRGGPRDAPGGAAQAGVGYHGRGSVRGDGAVPPTAGVRG